MKPEAPKPAARPKQMMPKDLVNGLLSVIRSQFVPDLTDKEWYKEHNQFIKVRVVMWPARQMNKKGFTVTPERYQQIILAILKDVKRHGQTGQVRYWPGYLMHCVQQHWEHHWEEYYDEAKAIRNKADLVLLGLSKHQQPEECSQVIEAVGLAHQFLASKKHARKKTPPPAQQGTFDLL